MKAFLISLLCLCGPLQTVSGQEDAADHDNILSGTPLDWQEQILQQVDAEMLGEAAYNELLEELSELVVWSDTAQLSLPDHRLRQRFVISGNRCLNQRAGFKDQSPERQDAGKAYLGDAWHHGVRYRMQMGPHLQAGLTLEKDPGEPWQSRVPPYDSWHGFVRWRKDQLTKHLKFSDAIIGHYRLRLGCGLVVSQGFSLGKQYLTQQLTGARPSPIIPHASLTESGFMQGMAADFRLGQQWSLLPYFSARQVDGTLDSHKVLTALQTDGFHRTTSEENRRNAAWQIVSGARLGWHREWFDIGIHASYTQLQYDYERQHNYYNANYFRGHELLQFATDYQMRAMGMTWRGECAIDDGGALACIHALHSRLGDDWRSILLYRYYDNHYRQLHASALAESSGMQGEQGFLVQIDGQPLTHWRLQGMVDYFRFSQPQYSIRDSVSQGFEASLRLFYDSPEGQRSSVSASAAYRIKQKGDYIRHSLDALLTPTFPCGNATLTCRTQVRGRIYSKKLADPSYGFAVSQSVGWQCLQWPRLPFTLEGQACYFRTDDYDARVYLTERTVLYGFGLPMLFGEGLRYAITGALAIGSRMHVDLKWALTNYANRASISSGLQQIVGNTQQDLWLQLMVKL